MLKELLSDMQFVQWIAIQKNKYQPEDEATEEEIINIINSLHQLALITYDLVSAELNQQAGINQAA